MNMIAATPKQNIMALSLFLSVFDKKFFYLIIISKNNILSTIKIFWFVKM